MGATVMADADNCSSWVISTGAPYTNSAYLVHV